MKSKKLVAIVAAIVIVIAAVVCYFVFSGKSDYCQVIPNDAIAIGKIDAKGLLQDNEIDPKSILKQFDLGEENTDVGIDLSCPVYAFFTPSMSYGLVAKLSDADKFEAFFKQQVEAGRVGEIEKQRGMKWVALDTYRLAVWDEEKVLVMGGGDADELRKCMATYMKQKKDESIMATSLFKELDKSKESLAMLIDGKQLSSVNSSLLSKASFVNSDVDYSEMHLKLALTVKDNKITLGFDVLPQTDKAKSLCETMGESFETIDADLIDRGISNPIVWMGMNVDGEKLLEQIKANPSIGPLLQLADTQIDISNVLRAIDGDIAVAMDMSNGKMNNPDMLLYSETKNEKFLQGLSSWQLVKFHELKEGNYLTNYKGKDVYLGKNKKGIYLTNNEDLCSRTDNTAVGLEDLKKEIKESRFYFTIDLQQVVNLPIDIPMAKNCLDVFKEQTKILDRLTFRVFGTHSEISLSVKKGNSIVKMLKALALTAKNNMSKISDFEVPTSMPTRQDTVSDTTATASPVDTAVSAPAVSQSEIDEASKQPAKPKRIIKNKPIIDDNDEAVLDEYGD